MSLDKPFVRKFLIIHQTLQGDFASSDFNLFSAFKNYLDGKSFDNDDEVKTDTSA